MGISQRRLRLVLKLLFGNTIVNETLFRDVWHLYVEIEFHLQFTLPNWEFGSEQLDRFINFSQIFQTVELLMLIKKVLKKYM